MGDQKIMAINDEPHQECNWVIRDCATPGCFTVIRERIGTQAVAPVCKWCDMGISHAMLGKPAVDIRLRGIARQA